MSQATEVQTTLEDQPPPPELGEGDPRDEEPSSLVKLAIEKGVDVEVLERLVALQERVTERDAEMAMAEAIAGFQSDCPPVPRTATADVRKNGRKQYEYHFAPLEKVVEVIRPHLKEHGLSYTHDAEVGGDRVRVTCTLQHAMGATRTATFEGPIDTSGGKNPIQQVASARSYGRRYSLSDVLGIVTEEDDDGAASAGVPETIGDQEVEELNGLIGEADADVRKFCEYMEVEHLGKLTFAQYPKARRALERKAKEAQKKAEGES